MINQEFAETGQCLNRNVIKIDSSKVGNKTTFYHWLTMVWSRTTIFNQRYRYLTKRTDVKTGKLSHSDIIVTKINPIEKVDFTVLMSLKPSGHGLT